MLFLFVISIVFLAPPAMLAGLIVLAVQNSQKKKKICKLQQDNARLWQELFRYQGTVAGGYAAEPGNVADPERMSGSGTAAEPGRMAEPDRMSGPGTVEETKRMTGSGAEETPKPNPVPMPPVPAFSVHPPQKKDTNWQGTAALVMGVIFVILAGAIFATTAWHLLPNVGKVVLVLAFSGIFFGASAIAQHKLHITGTSKAFYILGSVFLFVAALAVGFFGLMGPELTLRGDGRYLLLFVGTVMTETALLLGLRRFRETIYGGVCLFGITIAVMFLLASFHPGRIGFTAGMAVYGVLVAMAGKMLKNQEFGKCPQSITAAFPPFSLINLWGISTLVLLNLEWGVLSGGVTMLMAGLHLYLGETEDEGQTSTGAFALLLAAGILRAASPDSVDSCLYTGSLMLVILAAISHMGLLSSQARRILKLAGFCMSAVLLTGNLTSALVAGFTLAGVISMGLLLLDAALLALEYRTNLFCSMYNVMLAVFLNYLLFYMDLDLDIMLFLSSLIFGSLFLAARMFKTPFKTLTGDILFVLIAVFDAGVFWFCILLGWYDLYEVKGYLMAGGAVIMLTAMLAFWSREYRSVRYVLPMVPAVLPWMMITVLDRQFGLKLQYELSLMLYLLIVIVWDLMKKDRFCAGILVLGTWFGARFYISEEISLPFLPLLALYLALRHRELPENQKMVSYCGVCVYLLAGVYAAYASFLDNEVSRQLAAAAVMGVMFLVWKKRGRDLSMDSFFQAGFTMLYLTSVGAFCVESVSLWYLVPIVLLFAAAYLYSYIYGGLNLHFLTAAMTLVLPAVLWYQYNLTENQLYGAVMAAFAATAVIARMKWPLYRFTGENEKCIQADWYHILLILVLLPMTLAAPDDQWRTVYTLLLAAYVMQYATVKSMVQGAVTLAAGICVLAFWIQPWISWPGIVSLEICMIPAVAATWLLGKIWGNNRVIRDIQTSMYTLCLLSLVFDAYFTQKVADALILEGICLSVFLLSSVRKWRRPAAISGATAVAVVIYMTRGFWLSLSWWVYLLAAGIGLILFAAFNEMKKH